MSDAWAQVIARLVATEGGNQSRTARLVGVPQQTVGRWLEGARPDPEMIRKVARVVPHSIPFLMSAAYDIPLEEMAEGIGWDVLPFDQRITHAAARAHLAAGYALFAQLPQLLPPDDERYMQDL